MGELFLLSESQMARIDTSENLALAEEGSSTCLNCLLYGQLIHWSC